LGSLISLAYLVVNWAAFAGSLPVAGGRIGLMPPRRSGKWKQPLEKAVASRF
jgi:hypothetical protein